MSFMDRSKARMKMSEFSEDLKQAQNKDNLKNKFNV
jgi:hypothetical protein